MFLGALFEELVLEFDILVHIHDFMGVAIRLEEFACFLFLCSYRFEIKFTSLFYHIGSDREDTSRGLYNPSTDGIGRFLPIEPNREDTGHESRNKWHMIRENSNLPNLGWNRNRLDRREIEDLASNRYESQVHRMILDKIIGITYS